MKFIACVLFAKLLNLFTKRVNPMNFVNNLGYMGVGMVIIAVIGVIIGATTLLNKITSGK